MANRIGALIVDDQDDVRYLMRILIETENQGLHVSGEASGGHEALDMLDVLDPAVVVLDQMMPGLTGLETAAEILRRRPNQRLIMCSDYMDGHLRAEAEEIGVAVCLRKDEVSRLPRAIMELVAAG